MKKIIDLGFIFLRFVVTLFKSRSLVYNLARRDIQSKYLGSYLNFLWAFVQPTITILLLWFVFDVGFKVPPVEKYPFILWLIGGIIPWFFFSESLGNATNSILDYSYLVKKVVFKVSVIPIIKILSALFIHLFFIVVIFLAFLALRLQAEIVQSPDLLLSFCHDRLWWWGYPGSLPRSSFS